ncbi:MAG: 3'-5' exonuclease domain-containing protein 2 [Burkholderiaceae bacterium]
MSPTRPIPDKETMAMLPEFPRLGMPHITLVNTKAQAVEACARLREHTALGFDTESKPTFHKDQVSEGPHIVQLATLSHAWVFQLYDAGCSQQVTQLLGEPRRILAGFGLGDDNKRILAKLGVDPIGALELNTLFRERGYRKDMGVKAAVAVFVLPALSNPKAATSTGPTTG